MTAMQRAGSAVRRYCVLQVEQELLSEGTRCICLETFEGEPPLKRAAKEMVSYGENQISLKANRHDGGGLSIKEKRCPESMAERMGQSTKSKEHWGAR